MIKSKRTIRLALNDLYVYKLIYIYSSNHDLCNYYHITILQFTLCGVKTNQLNHNGRIIIDIIRLLTDNKLPKLTVVNQMSRPSGLININGNNCI